VADLAAVLAGLVLVVTEGTVERGELAQLVALELILTFGNRSSRLNDLMNELLGFGDLFLGIGHDQAVQIFILVARMGGIGLAFALLDGSFSSNCDFG